MRKIRSTVTAGEINKEFHLAQWNEPMVYEIGSPGERAIAPFDIEDDIEAATGAVENLVPAEMLRKEAPALPEAGQPRITRHYMRLGQEISSEDTHILFPMGTCSIKHNPKVHERLCRRPEFAEMHPRQPESTMQGMLEIMYKFQEYLKAISGLDAVCLEPAAGNSGVFLNARILRKYQEERGFGLDKKDEIISTSFSHPCNPSMQTMSGYKVITLFPGENGYADFEIFKAAINERTAGIILSCPEDTGIFNRDIKKITDAIHEVGGICIMDSANANGSLGWIRAKELGFDMIHWNLHKSFASIHGGAGPGAGPIAVREDLAKYLPNSVVEFDGENYHINCDKPETVGKVRTFFGNLGVILRSFSWVTSLGGPGLKMVSSTAVLNNNYMRKRIETEIPQVKMGMNNSYRLHEIRWTLTQVVEETGCSEHAITTRLCDYGIGGSMGSHPPYLITDAITVEPTETYSKDEIDEYVNVLKQVVKECYETPDVVKSAPHNTGYGGWGVDWAELDDPANVAPCYSAWKRVNK